MGFVILAGLITCLLFFLREGMDNGKFNIASFIRGICVSLVVVAITTFLSMITSACVYTYTQNYEIDKTYTYKLLQIAEESPHGYYAHQFRENEEYQYLCLYKKKNSIEPLTIDADDVILHKISDNETPKLQIQILNIEESSFLNFITFRCFTEKIEYHLYMPEDSINIY